MIHLKLTISCLMLLLLSAAIGEAQVQQKSYCLIPPPSPFKHNARIVTAHDVVKNRMRTTLEHPHALNKRDGQAAGEAVYLYASFVHQERRSSTRPTVDVAFISVAKEFKRRDSHGLILSIDKRELPTAGAAGYSSATANNGFITEAVKVALSYDELLSITNAKRVDARLGSTEFELTDNHLEALRELAALVAPAANMPDLR